MKRQCPQKKTVWWPGVGDLSRRAAASRSACRLGSGRGARSEKSCWIVSPHQPPCIWSLCLRLLCCLVAKSCLTLCDSVDCSTPGSLCPSLSSGVFSDSCPLTQRCYLTVLSSTVPFSFCLQSFPAAGSFQVRWLFASGGQRIRASALASVLPMNIQDWFLLRLTGLISLLSKGLSRVFSSTTIQKHQFFSAQSSLWSYSHICTWLLEKP